MQAYYRHIQMLKLKKNAYLFEMAAETERPNCCGHNISTIKQMGRKSQIENISKKKMFSKAIFSLPLRSANEKEID